jgi:hypothetical protein
VAKEANSTYVDVDAFWHIGSLLTVIIRDAHRSVIHDRDASPQMARETTRAG